MTRPMAGRIAGVGKTVVLGTWAGTKIVFRPIKWIFQSKFMQGASMESGKYVVKAITALIGVGVGSYWYMMKKASEAIHTYAPMLDALSEKYKDDPVIGPQIADLKAKFPGYEEKVQKEIEIATLRLMQDAKLAEKAIAEAPDNIRAWRATNEAEFTQLLAQIMDLRRDDPVVSKYSEAEFVAFLESAVASAAYARKEMLSIDQEKLNNDGLTPEDREILQWRDNLHRRIAAPLNK